MTGKSNKRPPPAVKFQGSRTTEIKRAGANVQRVERQPTFVARPDVSGHLDLTVHVVRLCPDRRAPAAHIAFR